MKSLKVSLMVKFLHIALFLLLTYITAQAQCPTGDIIFKTQAQIDDFGTQYPNCKDFAGSIQIGDDLNVSSKIKNINGLSGLTTIAGSLHLFNNDSLKSISPLQGLKTVGNNLGLLDNDSLKNLQGLSELTFVGGSLDIQKQDALTNINALSGLTSIGGGFGLLSCHEVKSLTGLDGVTSLGGTLNLLDNSKLASLTALKALKLVDKGISIQANDSLTNFKGLEGIKTTDLLSLSYNDKITNFVGFDSLTTVGSLYIGSNKAILNLVGLNSLETVAKDFYVYSCDAITSLNGVNSLKIVKNNLWIDNCPKLGSLQGIEALTTVGNDLRIETNYLLANIDGFQSLKTIGRDLRIYNNVIVAGITSLNAVEWIGGSVHIIFNPKLQSCSAAGLCNKLAVNPNLANIQNNLAGCNTALEILSRCTVLSSASGVAYYDMDCNGAKDNLDVFAAQTMVRNSSNQIPLAVTTDLGAYIARFPLQTTTDYTISAAAGYTVKPASYTITAGNVTQQFPNKDFGICPDSQFHNIAVTLTSLTAPGPGFENQYQVCVKNLGTHVESAILTLDLTLGIGAQYITIVDAASGTVQNNVITWNIGDLQLFENECFTVTIKLASASPLGIDLLPRASAQLLTIQPETTLADNVISLADRVIGSFDPNDKTVDKPNLVYNPASGVTRFQYKIRFQNTGTAPARFVEVLDTLESKLDIRTIEMVATSHPYTLSFPSANVLKWRFDPIDLPDSTSNEPASHGFIVFNISTKSPLNINDVVRNRAGIYFDYNAPVITNSAESSFVLGIEQLSRDTDLPISVTPNPAQDEVAIQYILTESAESQLLITNAQGQVIQSHQLERQSAGAHQFLLQLHEMPSGLYFAQLRSGASVGVARMVVVR
jgi:hypothetical protein